MTQDPLKLLAAIRGGFPPDTSSPVWDTVGQAMSSLAREPQRRIVLMLTDGQDTGAVRAPATLLEESERHLVSLYAVDYERRTDFRVPSTQLAEPSQWERDRDRARESLERLVRQTGGELFLLREGSTSVEDSFTRIAETLRTQYLLGFERTPDGKVKLHQSVNLTAAMAGTGAVTGALWGTLIGLLFLNPLAGAVVGAGVGAGTGAVTGSLTDIGVDDNLIREIGETLEPGKAAVFFLARNATVDRVIEALKPYNPRVIQTNLSVDSERELIEALQGKNVGAEAGSASQQPSS